MIIALLIPLLLGFFLLSLGIKKEGLFFWEKMALSFLAGVAFMVILMFILGLMRIPLDLSSILIAGGAIILVSIPFLVSIQCPGNPRLKSGEFPSPIHRGGVLQQGPQKISALECLFMFFISLKVVYVFFTALVKPVVDVDAISMYSFGAKAIFYSKTFLSPLVLGAIQDKPPFAYLAQAWVLIGLGNFNDCLIKILSPVMFLCLLVIFYSVLRKSFSRFYSLLFTWLLSTFPFLVFHAGTAYVDLPQTVYYSTAVLYLFLYMKNALQETAGKGLNYLIIAMMFSAFTLWIKRAGIFLAAINILILISYLIYQKRKDWQNLIPAFGWFTVIALPWIIYGKAQTFFGAVAGTAGGVAAETQAIGEVNKAGVVISTLLRKLFLYADWHLLWLLFLLAVIFCFRKVFVPPLLFLLGIILLNLMAIFADFSFTTTFQWIWDGTLLDRLVMNSIPVILYFCAEVFARPNDTT